MSRIYYFMCLYICVYHVKSVNISRSLLFHVFIYVYYVKSVDMSRSLLLPARASEQGNVIGLVSSCHQKKIVIERTRDLIYLKFVATDFSPKTISPSAGENSGDLA